MSPAPSIFDAAIVGGSYAGLSAALQLARARRRIVVIDAGVRRNRAAPASHGFLGQDGRAPADIAAAGRAEVLAYPTVRWVDGVAVAAATRGNHFALSLENGEALEARRLVLATGVLDNLPQIDGLVERWGTSVFHCPYCHGYELDRGQLGVLAVGPASYHQAMLLPDWGQVTLFTNGVFDPDATQSAALFERGVAIEQTPVTRIADRATVELADGRRYVLDGLFTASRTEVASPLARQLGCAFEEGPSASPHHRPLGTYIRTDALKATSVPGVFACGDAARAAGSVVLAVGDGAQAGMAVHQSLVFPPARQQ